MSPFQQQYPLSPRKFWKKFLPVIFQAFIFCAVLAVVSAITIALIAETGGPALSPSLLGVGGSVLLYIVLLFIYSWYYKAYIRSYAYDGGQDFITIKKGVFAPKEIHVQYAKIQDVYVDQDILDRIMGLYDVHIASATAASGMEAHIDGVDTKTAEGLKNFFLAKVRGGDAPGALQGGSMPVAPSPQPVQFSGDISSASYPIQPGWIPKMILSSFVASIIFAGIFALVGWSKSKGATFDSFLPLFLTIFVVWFVGSVIYQFLWKNSYRFAFTPEYIQFNTGVFSKQERHLPYKSIQDVSIKRSVLDQIFGLADVTIENAAQMTIKTKYGNRAVSMGMSIVGQTPERAAKITETLKQVLLTKDSSRMGL